jgi:hypothetical protein
MHRTTRVVAVATALVASALLVPGSAASASADHPGEGQGQTTLQFDVVFSPFNLVDLGQPGVSAGDVIVFHDTILRDDRQAGDMAGTCTVIEATPPLANCTGVARMDEQNTITFAFLNAPPPKKVFAITGGSGTYRTAQGDGLLEEHGDGTGTLTLNVLSK